MNIYIFYEINLLAYKQGAASSLGNLLFGAVQLTKNSEFNKYRYSGYGIGVVARGSFLLSDGSGFGKNVIIFGANMSSSVQFHKRKKVLKFLVKVQCKG